MPTHAPRLLLAALGALLIAGCGARPQAAGPGPSPTVVAMVPTPTAAPPTAPPATRPAARAAPTVEATSPPAPIAAPGGAPTVAAEAPFTYLWPDFVPENMAPAPKESRVAREGELGPGDIGFYVVTFNGGGRKLIVGGGAAEALPITGRITTLRLGERGARLVTNDDQRQLIISGYEGSLFVYGVGLSEEELLRVAGSLRPIDVREMRRRVGMED
ncbi:MAG TPA: hypothetical protein VNL77_23445 [Roseiflexaceae bacterium]|nr:hypothetical protein [Roseiflexaceae bacterium]